MPDCPRHDGQTPDDFAGLFRLKASRPSWWMVLSCSPLPCASAVSPILLVEQNVELALSISDRAHRGPGQIVHHGKAADLLWMRRFRRNTA
jgi:hypothetical protein